MKMSERAQEEKRLDALTATLIQFIGSCFTMTLKDPDVIGKDTMGYERMQKIIINVAELYNYYLPAFWIKHNERAYYQDKLVERMNKTYGKRIVYESFDDMFVRANEIQDYRPHLIQWRKEEVQDGQ